MTDNFSIAKEIMRKSFHLLLLLVPFLYYQLGKWDFLKIVTPLAIAAITLDYYRHKNDKIKLIFEKIFGNILRDKERQEGQFNGTSYALGASVLLALVCPEPIFITSFLILSISDLMASLVGKSIVSKPFFEKSVAGSVAFYISGLLVIFICGAAFELSILFYVFAIFALFCTTVIEARPSLFDLDDNFSIPASFAILMSAFDLIWNFL